MMIPIVLQHGLCPGDTAVMTVIPRELYRQYPGKFEVSVCTNHLEIWEENPFVAQRFLYGKDSVPSNYRVVPVNYNPREEKQGKHFMQSYLDSAAEGLREFGVERLALSEFRPCIHLTQSEKEIGPSPRGVLGGKPYWLIMAGGKMDATTKWWDPKSWQQVAHLLASDPTFPLLAQVGRNCSDSRHYRLKDCVSLLDLTTLRELIWLTYHSRGVICGVTSLMHIAAALRKPCVVVAGGREAWWWDSYDERSYQKHKDSIPTRFEKLQALRPRHVYLDTLGQLPCCREEGCWKSGIGEKQPEKNCVDVVRPPKYSPRQTFPLPRCMTMITPRQVVEAANYLEKGSA